MNICYLWKILIVEVEKLNKPRRIRIYKLSTFDTFTEEERALNEAYKKAGIKERATLKKIRDEKIASYEGIRKIERKKLYTYKYDKNKKAIKTSEEENINKQIAIPVQKSFRSAIGMHC